MGEIKEKELSDFKLIFHRAIRFHQSNIIRNYISSVEKNATEKGEFTKEISIWTEWAKKKVDWYDPLVNSEDETFDDNDKATIFYDLLKESV